MSAAVSPKVFDFLRQLTENNHREWFTENKNLYTESQENIVLFLEELIKEMSEFDPELGKLMLKNLCSEFTGTPVSQKIKHHIKPTSALRWEWEKAARKADIISIWSQENHLLPEEFICRNPPF